MHPVDIIVPVNGNVDALRRCIESVREAKCATAFELIVVNHTANDPELARYLREQSERTTLKVIDHPALQGYAAAVNHTFRLHPERNVVILQADAEVAGDWLDRLSRHAIERGVGIVGCFTNRAGTATYPLPRARNPLPAGLSVRQIDTLFAAANPGGAATLPTVTGPCLFFRRDCLAAVGAFDGAPLGSDYGVEIDFALRAGSAGFRHLVAGDVFVGSGGQGAFGTAAADELADRTELALSKLYPTYAAQKAAMLEQDPVRQYARRVDLLRLAESPRQILVFVAHPWGGGIRRHMHDLAQLLAPTCEVLILEPAVGDTVKLSWLKAGESFVMYFALPAEMPTLAAVLRTVGASRLHFHHVHLLPRAMLELPSATGLPYDCTLHDYYAICPQYHLVDEAGRYCGEPDATGCAACLTRRPPQWGLDITAWRGLFGVLLRGAERVIAPSRDVAQRIGRYFPDLEIAVWPHPEFAPPPVPRIVRVAVLGNLSPEKGLHVIAACARDAQARGLPLVFRVLGSTTEPISQQPDAPLTIYGQYVDAELANILLAEKPDVIVFAAQVPETYSYTLSVALRSGLPIVASALGAFPERLAVAPQHVLVPWDAAPAVWNNALLRAAGWRDAATSPTAPHIASVTS